MSSVVYLFLLAVLTSGISAHEEPRAVALYERQITPAPSQSVATQTSAALSSTTTTPPNEILEAVNITLDGQIFPPSIHIEGVTTTTNDFTINCDNCAITGDFSLSAGDDKIPGHVFKTPPDVEHRANGTDYFKGIWAAATVESLNATFEFGINLKASNPNNELSVPLYSQTKSLTIGIFTLSATLETEIHGWVNTSNDVNFTYGFELGVPAYSEVIINLSDTNSTSLGFNETSLAPTPFKSTRSDIDVDIELSFRPTITFVISVGGVVASGSLSVVVGLDVPKLDVGIKQVHNVSSSCDPAPASLPPDQNYQNLTLVSPSLGIGSFEILEENATLFGAHVLAKQQQFDQTLLNQSLTTTCLLYDAAKQTFGPAPEVKPAHLSNASGVYAPLAAALTAIAIVALTAII